MAACCYAPHMQCSMCAAMAAALTHAQVPTSRMYPDRRNIACLCIAICSITGSSCQGAPHLRSRLPLLKFHTVTAPLFVPITKRRWFLSKLMAVTQLLLVAQGPHSSSVDTLAGQSPHDCDDTSAAKRPSRAPSCVQHTDSTRHIQQVALSLDFEMLAS